MNEVSYFADLHGRRSDAIVLPRVAVRYRDGSSPAIAECHANVDLWVAENPGTKAVRGWVIIAEGGGFLYLAAHSVLQREDGSLVEITPLPASRTAFLLHTGSEELFRRLAEARPTVTWPPVLATAGNPELENLDPGGFGGGSNFL